MIKRSANEPPWTKTRASKDSRAQRFRSSMLFTLSRSLGNFLRHGGRTRCPTNFQVASSSLPISHREKERFVAEARPLQSFAKTIREVMSKKRQTDGEREREREREETSIEDKWVIEVTMEREKGRTKFL